MDKINLGQTFEEEFIFSQEDVIAFAEVTGDKNPIHLDEEYTRDTIYKRPIIHGYLGGSIFSKILGNDFPGEGTVYLNQKLEFRRPMYSGVKYKAILSVKEIFPSRHRAIIDTKVVSVEDNKPVITGEASVMNKHRILE